MRAITLNEVLFFTFSSLLSLSSIFEFKENLSLLEFLVFMSNSLILSTSLDT